MAELLKKGETIHSSLKQVNAPKTIAQLSKKFVEQMQKGNVDSAIKLISDNMQNGILPLTDTTLKLLKQKHPKSALMTEEVLLLDQPESIHQIKYKCSSQRCRCSSQSRINNQRWIWTFGDRCRWLEKNSDIETVC